MKRYEIEQKYRLGDPAAMRARLKALGAVRLRRGKEWNEFWDRGGELMRRKNALRLRRLGAEAWLTLKGPRKAGRSARRLELQTAVRYREARAILGALGYRRVCRYFKYREEYRLDPCVITLDRLAKFGWFLEIEAPRSVKIPAMARRLKIGEKDREERSYFMMVFGRQKKWRALHEKNAPGVRF